MTLEAKLQLVDALRAHGVLEFEDDEVRLVLLPLEVGAPAVEREDPELDKVGRDGLTLREQVELYGAKVDSSG